YEGRDVSAEEAVVGIATGGLMGAVFGMLTRSSSSLSRRPPQETSGQKPVRGKKGTVEEMPSSGRGQTKGTGNVSSPAKPATPAKPAPAKPATRATAGGKKGTGREMQAAAAGPGESAAAGGSLLRQSDRAIAQHLLIEENARQLVQIARILRRHNIDLNTAIKNYPGLFWIERGRMLEQRVAVALEQRGLYLGIEQAPKGIGVRSVSDLLHVGEGTVRPFADIFPLNPRQLHNHLTGRWYSPYIDPLVYTQPPSNWSPYIPGGQF
ncbi:hypothetical protein ACFLRT_03670, partial [Acidobacteriota bacterium]